MKRMRLLIFLFALAVCNPIVAQEKERLIPYTQADRDRMVRVEAKLEEFKESVNQRFLDNQRAMDVRFEALDKRMSALENWMLALFSMMVALFGYIVWDRRTTLIPLERELKQHNQRLERLEGRAQLMP